MQWRTNKDELGLRIEGSKDGKHYVSYARINSKSRLHFYGDLPNKMCTEIEGFLKTQKIYVDKNEKAYAIH